MVFLVLICIKLLLVNTVYSVDRWSAGCQVFASAGDFAKFMELVEKSAEEYGPSFSYTLLMEKQL